MPISFDQFTLACERRKMGLRSVEHLANGTTILEFSLELNPKLDSLRKALASIGIVRWADITEDKMIILEDRETSLLKVIFPTKQ